MNIINFLNKTAMSVCVNAIYLTTLMSEVLAYTDEDSHESYKTECVRECEEDAKIHCSKVSQGSEYEKCMFDSVNACYPDCETQLWQYIAGVGGGVVVVVVGAVGAVGVRAMYNYCCCNNARNSNTAQSTSQHSGIPMAVLPDNNDTNAHLSTSEIHNHLLSNSSHHGGLAV